MHLFRIGNVSWTDFVSKTWECFLGKYTSFSFFPIPSVREFLAKFGKFRLIEV